MINNLTVMSIGLVGITLVLLLILPIFLYIKDINQAQRTGVTFIESAVKNFIWHISLCFVACFFFAAWQMVSEIGYSSSFSPEVGIKAFLNIDGSNISLAKYWDNVARDLGNINYDSNQVTQKAQRFISYSLVFIIYLGMAFWIALFLLPLTVVLTPLFLAFRYHQRNKDNYQGYQPYFRYLIIGIGLLVMLTLHFGVVDIFIASLSDRNYSLLQASINIWKNLAMGS